MMDEIEQAAREHHYGKRMPKMKHELKSWPQYFQPVWVGVKIFEIRQNDRNFELFDEVVLQEWDPNDREYTGREIEGYIEYIVDFHQYAGWVVFQLHVNTRSE